MNRRALAELIKRAREGKGLTQDQLAAEIKISTKQVSRWETCQALPHRRTLPRLATSLDLNLSHLYDLVIAAKDEDIADAQEDATEARRELADVRRDLEYALTQVKLFVDTYAEFHAEYQRIGDQVNQLASDIAEIKQVVLGPTRRGRS